MSGKMSRDKGSRNERALVAHLLALGWNARRIPLSGAMEGFKCDVIATKGPDTVKFEVKSRNSSFTKIYALLDSGEMARIHNEETGGLVAITTNFDALRLFKDRDFKHARHYTGFGRTISKIFNMQKLLGEADFLAIKDDRRPFLFLEYKNGT